jgi:hypothetical protein
VIIIAVLGLCVVLALLAFRVMPRIGRPGRHFAISLIPLLLTTVVSAPFALASRGPNDMARKTVVALSVVGVALSFILFTVGTVLTLRTARAGDSRGAVVLALETGLAGLPALIMTAYVVVFRFL